MGECPFQVGDIVWVNGGLADNLEYAQLHFNGKLGPYVISHLEWLNVSQKWLAHFEGQDTEAYTYRLRHDVFMNAVKKAVKNA